MTLSQKLGKNFVITTELGPVKGVLADESLEKARAYLPLDGINIHDCPMGNLRINSISMAGLIQNSLDVEAVPHFTCRDRSLLGTQADLLGAHTLGIRNILVTTGDPPKHGPYPSKAVYDYNTFDLIRLIKKMNNGLDYNEKEFGGSTDFNIACTAMPTSRNPEHEIERMAKKISAGADFFQTQVVYDSEKAVTFLKAARKLNKPILIGVMPLKSVKMARFMDVCLVLHAEHSFNASTFAAREVASTRAHMYAAIAAAIGSLSGELHGGANVRVMEMLLGIGSPDAVDDYVNNIRDSIEYAASKSFKKVMLSPEDSYRTFMESEEDFFKFVDAAIDGYNKGSGKVGRNEKFILNFIYRCILSRITLLPVLIKPYFLLIIR